MSQEYTETEEVVDKNQGIKDEIYLRAQSTDRYHYEMALQSLKNKDWDFEKVECNGFDTYFHFAIAFKDTNYLDHINITPVFSKYATELRSMSSDFPYQFKTGIDGVLAGGEHIEDLAYEINLSQRSITEIVELGKLVMFGEEQ